MDFRKYIPINTDVASNPYNWVIVALMVLIGGLLLALVFANFPTPTGDD